MTWYVLDASCKSVCGLTLVVLLLLEFLQLDPDNSRKKKKIKIFYFNQEDIPCSFVSDHYVYMELYKVFCVYHCSASVSLLSNYLGAVQIVCVVGNLYQ